MVVELTKEEENSINMYRTTKYLSINQLLSMDVESDISLIMSGEKIDYSQDSVIENIELIKKISVALIKNSLNSKIDWSFYRVVNVAEINRLKAENKIDRFFLASKTGENARKNVSDNNSKYVLMQLCGDSSIPFISLNEEFDEIIIAPFLKVVSIEENYDVSYNDFIRYKVVFENQKDEKISQIEEEEILKQLIDNANIANEKLKECIELEKENIKNFESIRKLEQLLYKRNNEIEKNNYDNDNLNPEKIEDLDDIERIKSELDLLKSTTVSIFDKRKENLFFFANWKKDLIKCIKTEFQVLKNRYIFQKENMKLLEEVDINEEKNIEEVSENMEEINWSNDENFIIEKKELDPEVAEVKKECQENIAVVDTLINNIKDLIYKQQNHARIAELLNSNYKALNNAFEMKNNAEELLVLVNAICNKLDFLTKENKDELQKILKTNIQISTLLNYLNNPKSAVSKKINRFEELNILEENELKREIAETIKNIRCEAELKKLRDDFEILQERSTFKKFIGRFTGRNKLNEAMLEQIEIRQTAVKKTFKVKMPLAKNYSIHNMIAEIEIFIQDNKDDELVAEDVSTLRNIRDNLKKNFIIIDSRVVSIIDQKTGKNLPFDSRKMSKKELIEIDTYRFLNKYGYDSPIKSDEPEYQDTLAKEIKRIVEYIKTSDIL